MNRLLLFLLLPLSASAQFSLAPVFQNNMVLQAEKPLQFFGKGIPGATIQLQIASKTYRTSVQADSTWGMQLPAKKSTKIAEDLTFITDKDTLILKNILFGEVWLCIGQSNMEFPFRSEMHYKKELIYQTDEVPLLRFYSPQYIGKNLFGKPYSDSMKTRLENKDLLTGNWEVSTRAASADMSAIGYFFGKMITQDLQRPAGMIHLSIGGSPIETWISSQSLNSDERFKAKMNGDWTLNPALPVWIRQRALENIGNKAANGPHTFQPGMAFEHMVEKLTSLPIRGILFYQGESNAQEKERVEEYVELMKLMVDDYRVIWKDDKLPFYFVQLSSIDSIKYKSQLWPEFRAEQLRAMQLIPHSGMAVSHDKGSQHDVHPTDKKTIAERLYRWAAHFTYNKKEIVPSGPIPTKARLRNGKIELSFDYCGKGLKTSDGKSVTGFSLDGKQEVTATIKRNKVYITTNEKKGIVTYCFQPFSNSNLVNSEELPAPGFKIAFGSH